MFKKGDNKKNKNAVKHGYFGTPTYSTWQHMKHRCDNTKNHAYADYGGRGISYTDKWSSFENFLEDMGDRPNGLTLDRIDNEKGYSKENCKWSSVKEQSNNKRNNHLITHDNKTMNITQWAEYVGVSRNIIYSRIRRGLFFLPNKVVHA